jgi:glyoxylase-like metal-dependent hydrolase (beta-lactamase superfamily II)
MREVVDGVIEIAIGYVNAYAVVVDDGVVLVDTGLPGRADKVANAVEDARRRIGEVHTILLTHWHPDHVGNVAELRRRSGARIVAHAIDSQVISGAKPRPTRVFMRVVGAIMPAPEPVPVDETLTADGPIVVPGFAAFHTPGHTPGHVSFLLDRGGGVLFTGDAVRGRRNGRIGRSPRWSPRTARPSQRASRGSRTSASSRPRSATAGRYPVMRRSGFASSWRAANGLSLAARWPV